MSDFTVTKKAMRPASNAIECFYCHQPIGAVHKANCVLINKKVKIRMTVEYEIEVPASWGKAEIEFFRNDGAWCCDGAISELDEYFGGGGGPECMCGSTEFEYVGGDSEAYLDED